MVDTERISGELDPARSTLPYAWLRSLANPWLVAGLLALLALGHGRFEYVRWSAHQEARQQAEARRQADADKAQALADAAAVKRREEEDTRSAAKIETLEAAATIARPEPSQAPTPPAAAVVPVAPIALIPAAPCDGVEARAANERDCPARKESFKDCPECPEMIVIPAGGVMMGSPLSEGGRASNEGPQHKVAIATQFAAGRFETTFAEWDACFLAGGCTTLPNDRGWGRGRRPVVNVSWQDAKAYAAWLSARTNLKYRLLTEAEWEYAARAGTSTAFSTGATITSEEANFDGAHASGGGGRYRKSTIEVGSFPPNAFGLHDMHGNVWEWVEDCWHKDYGGGPGNGSAWTDRCNERARVLRGGSWIDPPRILRSAYRSRNIPTYRGATVGFRVARTLD